MLVLDKIREALKILPEMQRVLKEIEDILGTAVVEKDDFVAFLKHERKHYRKVYWNATKSGKRIEAMVHSSWLTAQSRFQFGGSRRVWEHLLQLEPRPESEKP